MSRLWLIKVEAKQGAPVYVHRLEAATVKDALLGIVDSLDLERSSTVEIKMVARDE